MKKTYVITAAGGNGTAIRFLESPLSRKEYETQGKYLMAETESQGAEQCGFLILPDRHLEMSGGEFCGNASRAAAVLFSLLQNKSHVHFTVSGFVGMVEAVVQAQNKEHFFVECVFPGLPTEKKEVSILGDQKATLIDLGGIVHVVIKAPFPSAPEIYQRQHRIIRKELNLEERDAVGVVWIDQGESSVSMHPVVWVKAIDTFFYETSCGSGTIAVAKTTGIQSIVQPTTQIIEAVVHDNVVTLKSEMEVVYESS